MAGRQAGRQRGEARRRFGQRGQRLFNRQGRIVHVTTAFGTGRSRSGGAGPGRGHPARRFLAQQQAQLGGMLLNVPHGVEQ